MNPISKFVAYFRLQYAIDKANAENAKDGDRYYVIPYGKKLIVICRKWFKYYKRKGLISREAHIDDLIRISFYYTPHLNGKKITSDVMDIKKRLYYGWWKTIRRKNRSWKLAKLVRRLPVIAKIIMKIKQPHSAVAD